MNVISGVSEEAPEGKTAEIILFDGQACSPYRVLAGTR